MTPPPCESVLHFYLVLVAEILMTQVSYQPDQAGLEADDRRI